uniref:DUF616 domain-containing protein n=1 Tax=viral metagenome TaxID=1070528 RepID=A0A6C0HE92_9ZZZZ
MAKICFITAVFGNYELSCKKFVKQTIDTDFICFTDNKNIISNGWIIDNTPYFIINKSKLDDGYNINSIYNNRHTFNISKYYKQAFQNIPRLKQYDVIVWLDGTVEIIYDKVSEYILENIYKHKIIGWNHEWRNGILKEEVNGSLFYKYTSTYWNRQKQPVQDVIKQYETYVKDGYNDEFFKPYQTDNPNIGVWLTCFVAFLNNDEEVTKFLDLWYLQTLNHTTQDQIGFSYVCQKLNFIPYTLPNNEVSGEKPHTQTLFYIKREHGQ